MTVGGAAAGRFSLSECLADGARLGAQAATDAGFGKPFASARSGPVGLDPSPRWPKPGSGAKAFLDFQNDVTVSDVELAHREGYGRARAREALHDARHGHRAGQDRQRRRAGSHRRAHRPHDPRGGDDRVPPALYARVLRGAGRQPPWCRSSGRNACRRRTRGRRHTARSSQTQGCGCARSISAGPAKRAGSRASRARRGRCARRSAFAMSRRWARSMCRAPDAAALPRSRLRQHTLDAAGRARALRRDAARGRLRARRRHGEPAGRAAFCRHDHDGARGQGAGAPAVLPPGAVAGARRGRSNP